MFPLAGWSKQAVINNLYLNVAHMKYRTAYKLLLCVEELM